MSQLELVFRLLAHLFSVNNTNYYEVIDDDSDMLFFSKCI